MSGKRKNSRIEICQKKQMQRDAERNVKKKTSYIGEKHTEREIKVFLLFLKKKTKPQ